MIKLNKALLHTQYSHLWDMGQAMSEMWEGEPVLSKIWLVSKDRDTGMLGAADVISKADGVDAVDASELILAIEQLGYPFVVVSGRDVGTAIAKSFVYVWGASDGGELKADLVGLARNLNLDTVMFQSVDGDYQLITCAEGSVVSKRSLGKEAFGVLNGHFYKVAAGRPFELDDLVGLSFERINHVKENFIC